MSKRKNAGEGYGYMFHGSFSSKDDARKKERSRKGAFIKPTRIKGERRYTVMSPRTNPIKRRKKIAKTAAPAVNPSELLVMGANPARKIIVPPGDEYVLNNESSRPVHITIRTNPTGEFAENGMLSSIGEFIHSKTYAGKLAIAGHKAQKRQRKAGKWARMSRENRRALVIAAGVSPSVAEAWSRLKFSEIPEGWRDAIMVRLNPRSNPSAARIREEFTGTPAEGFTTHEAPHVPAGDYAQLGELLALYVKPKHGGQVQQIDFKHNRPLLVSDESARQLYFVGGDQDLTASLAAFGVCGPGIVELGEARRIDYKQRKEHVPHPDMDQWRHEFGEESGMRPKLLFDTQARQLLLEGGEYVVRREGIIN